MSFAIIAILVLPGLILTHMSVGALIPTISDLPANLIQGFDEVFKFAYLKKDSENMKAACVTTLNDCKVIDPALTCPNFKPDPNNPTQKTSVDTTASKAAIKTAFTNSLSVVQKIANDKYFGTADFKETANNLNKVTAEVDKIQPSMKCYAAVPTFCTMWTSSDGLVKGMDQVNKAIDTFKTSDMIKTFDDNKDLLTILHALPYFLVISLLFFACFWWKGGVCCCCRGGSVIGSLAIIPSALFWLAAFIIYTVVMAVGCSIKYFSNKIEVPVFQGKPTLDVAVKHIIDNYPEFWNVVFKDMVAALDLLLLASFFFVAACILQSLYSCLEMCCCPYRAKDEPKEPAAAPAPGLMAPAGEAKPAGNAAAEYVPGQAVAPAAEYKPGQAVAPAAQEESAV